MRTASIFGAFNARWLKPEDVARSFVPTVPYKSLVRHQHSLLMGPRGCGKTTLLKMLTRPAQRVWNAERAPSEPSWADYHNPDFAAIYIPSDVRWSMELRAITHELRGSSVDAERVQRASVSICSLVEATKVFQDLLAEAKIDSIDLVRSLISHLKLGPVVPTFSELRLKVMEWIEDLHYAIVRRDPSLIKERLDSLPRILIAHSTSAVTMACKVFDECVPSLSPSRWALCYDELEIAPEWLQSELFEALRSIDQQFLLKLTWSPILPSHLMPRQERQQDFFAIRMWHSHFVDAKAFCTEFSTRLLRDRLRNNRLTPRDVLGASPFAHEESEREDPYREGSQIWRAMVDLAKADASFREYLREHGVSPENPFADSVSVRDESLRKVKPIVLARETFLKGSSKGVSRRTRKNPPLYYGEDAVYAMSEGNPRLLAGLLSELLDVGIQGNIHGQSLISRGAQSRVLYAASQRMLSAIRSYPVAGGSQRYSLASLVFRLGNFLHSEIFGQEFKPDPVGSFFVDEDVRSEIVEQLTVGLLIGAFIHVKTIDEDIPSSVVGSKFRLSYVLAPYFQLLFRNFRELRLSTALRMYSISQRSLFVGEEGKL